MALDRIPLAEVIDQLRSQLIDAMKAGEGQDLQFLLKDLELELKVGVTRSAGVEAGGEADLKFWIFSGKALGKAEASLAKEQLQTVKLRLEPQQAAKDGARDEVLLGIRRSRERG